MVTENDVFPLEAHLSHINFKARGHCTQDILVGLMPALGQRKLSGEVV